MHNMQMEGVKLHIGKLAEGVSKADLDAAFGDFRAEVKDMWIARNPPGFGFVRVTDAKVDAFIEKYNNLELNGSAILIERARVDRPRGDRFVQGGKRGRDQDFSRHEPIGRDAGRGERRDRDRRRSDSRDRRRRSRSRSDSRDRRRRSPSRDREEKPREDKPRRKDSRERR